MQIVNMHEAKTHLSKLIAKAVAGEPFVIAKAGKPLVKVEAIAALGDVPKKRKLGMLQGMYVVPDDIKTSFAETIEGLFYGDPDKFA